ncbi:MAG: DUF4149 domain-containing protein [Gemmatimonadaceae bacterium]
MKAIRWVEYTTAAWLGAALITAATVAPAAFAVLPTRTLAGDLVGRVLPVLFLTGAALALGLVAMGRRGPKAGRRVAIGAVWLAAMLGAQFVVTPRVRALRAGMPIDQLSREDPRRVSFGRLHAVSVGLLGVGMLAALVVLISGARRAEPSV